MKIVAVGKPAGQAFGVTIWTSYRSEITQDERRQVGVSIEQEARSYQVSAQPAQLDVYDPSLIFGFCRVKYKPIEAMPHSMAKHAKNLFQQFDQVPISRRV